MLTAFAGHSVNSIKDTVPQVMWIPVDDALKVLGKAKTAQILEQRVSVLQSVIDSLNTRIAIKDATIKEYVKNESLYQKQIEILRSEMKDHVDVRAALVKQLDDYEKLIKKLRRKVRWTAIAGIFTTTAAIVLPLIL